MIDLGKEILEEIVKDGVKEMLARVVGKSRAKKQKAWFTGVKAAINEYQQRLKKDYLPTLLKDFSTEIVKFSGGKMSEEDRSKIKVFMEMVKKSDIKSVDIETRGKAGRIERRRRDRASPGQDNCFRRTSVDSQDTGATC